MLEAFVALDRWGDGHMWNDGGGWMWVWGGLMMLLWVAVIAVVVWLVLRSTRTPARGLDDARRILAERLARGEITTDEYRDRLQHLSG